MTDELFFDGMRYVSAAEAADVSHLTRDYIARLAREGRIAGKQVARQWYVREESLKAFLLEQDYLNSQRRVALARERQLEYDRSKALNAPQDAAVLAAASMGLAGKSPSNSAFRQSATAKDLHRKLFNAAMRSGSDVATKVSTVASNASAQVPLYAVSPGFELLHKIAAAVLALALVVGLYTAGGSLSQTSPEIAINPASPQLALTASTGFIGEALSQFADSIERGVEAFLWPFTGSYFAQNNSSTVTLNIAGAPVSAQNQTVPTSAATSKTVQQTIIENPVVERVVQTQSVSGGVGESELNQKLQQLSNALDEQIFASTAANSTVIAQNYNVTAQSNAIDQLNGTTISNASISGGSISNAGISGGTISGATISGAGFTGTTTLEALAVSSNATSTYADGIDLSDGCFSINGNCIGAGGGNPGGSDTQVQFNQAGTFSGSPQFTFSAASNTLSVLNASTTNATSTNLFASVASFTSGVFGSLSATVASLTGLSAINATTTNATTTNLYVSGQTTLANALPVSSGGTGTSTAPSYGQLLVGNSSGGFNLVATSSLGITAGGGSSDVSTSSQNMWSALQIFAGNASSSNFSNFGTAYFGGSATSSFNSAGQLTLAGLTSSLLSVNSSGQVVATSTIGNGQLQNSSITVNGIPIALGNSATISAASSTLLGNNNTWTGLNTFSNATTTLATLGTAWFSGLSNSILAVDQNGLVVATTSIGVNYLTGTLPVANGGTGSTTLTGILKGNGTGRIQSAVGGTDYEFPLTFSTGLNRTGNTITNTGILALGNYATTTGTNISISTSTFTANGQTLGLTAAVSAGAVLLAPTISGTLNNSGLAHSTIVLNGTTLTLGDTSDTISVASSTLLADNNTFSGNNIFSNTLVLTNGLLATASSTIGNGTRGGGLTIFGGATTTGTAYFAGSVGIGTSSPAVALDVAGAIRSNTQISLTNGTLKTLAAFVSSGGNGQLQVNDSNGTIDTLLGANDVSYITTNQNKFGIENKNPAYPLDVTGGSHFSSFIDAANFIATSSSVASVFNYILGIGTTSPFARFSLAGSAGGTTPLLSISSSTASATTTVFAIDANGNTTIGNNGSALTINGATTTASNGINLTTGCFAFGGSCLTLNSFAGILGVANGGTGWANITSGDILFGNAANALATSSKLFFNSTSGFLGVGTSSPYAQLTVSGGSTGNAFEIDSSASAASTTLLTVSNAGLFSVGDDSGSSSGIFTIDASSSTTTISNLSVGNLVFDTDAGIVNLSDIPVDSGAASGVQQAQIINIGGNPIFTASGIANGSGGVTNLGIAIGGTTTPYATLEVWGPDTSAATQAFSVVNNASSTLFMVNDLGNVSIGTTTPTAKFSIQGTAGNGQILDIASSTGASLLHLSAAGNLGIGTSTPGSIFSIQNVGNFVASATSTIYNALAIGGNLNLSNLASALLSTNANGQVVATTSIGTNLLSGALATINTTSITAGGTFTITAASSTLLANNNTFSGNNIFSNTLVMTNGLLATASSTIGNGTQTGGLTIFGGATTTGNAFFGGNVGIGSSTPGSILSVAGSANFVNGATSTIYNGLNVSGGCISLNGNCLPTTNASSTLLTDNNTFSGTDIFSNTLKLTNGFISSASSTVVGNFTATGNLALGGNLAVSGTGTSTFAGNLTVGASNANYFPNAPLVVTSNVNNYGQEVLQNLNSGSSASEDLILGSNLMTDTSYYGDLGYNSSNNSGAFAPNDLYLYSSDSNLDLAAASSTTGAINFFTGGTSTSTNERMTISNAGNVGIGTSTPTSLFSIAGTSAQNPGGSSAELTNPANWNSTNWTGTQGTGFTHTTGNTSVLTGVVTITAGTAYIVTYTISGRTIGTCIAAIGGATLPTCTNNGTRTSTIIATNSNNLTFTPTSPWNGTISSISVKQVAPAAPAVTLFDSTGAPSLQLFAPKASLFDTFIGLNAGASTTAAGNSAFGADALQNNVTGNQNSAFGDLALASNIAGSQSTAFGYEALTAATTTSSNTAFGAQALFSDISGAGNDAFGSEALFGNTTGIDNLAIGDGALANNDNSNGNIAIGFAAQENPVGSSNIIIGTNIDFASSTASDQLDIGNTIFGTGLYGGGNGSGDVGINTPTPIDELQIPGLANPVEASSTTSGLNTPYSVYVSGRYAYVASNTNNSLVVFDISNPASPTEIGSTTSGLSSPESIYVSGRYAYVVSLNGLTIFDISNPALPTEVGSTATGLNNSLSVYVSGRYAYVASASNNSLVVFDISNPASPTEIGSTTSGLSGPSSVYVSGRYAYVASLSNNVLVVFDISNPALPTEVGSTPTGLNNPVSVYVSGRYAYVANINGLTIFDISNPASPTDVGSASAGLSNPTSVYVSGRYAYVASQNNNSLVVFDISNPASPTEVGSISSGLSFPNSVYVSGRYAYVASENNSSLTTFQIGGEYTQSLEAGTLQAGSLELDNNLQALDGAFSGGLTVGNNVNVGGSFSLTASTFNATTTAGKNYSIFSLNTASSSVPIMTALYNGNVGIGTSTPFWALTVASSTGPQLALTDTVAADNAWTFRSISNTLYIATSTATATSTTPAVTINQNGLFGIGTSTPGALLAVNGNVLGNGTLALTGTTGTTTIANGQGFTIGGTHFIVQQGSGNVGIGTTTPLSTLTVVGSGCFGGTSGTTILCGTTAGNIYYRASNVGNYDVAEDYVDSDRVVDKPGTIMAVDTVTGNETVTIATSSQSIFGIISTNPGMILGGSDASTTGESVVPIALSGRVPVKISLSNGSITEGDRLALSTTTPGTAVKALVSGETIGIALQSATSMPQSGKIDVFVQSQYYMLPIAANATSTPAALSTNFFSSASTVLQQEIAGISSTVVHLFQDATYASVGIFNKIYTQELHTDKLCISDSTGETCVTRAQLNALLANADSSQSGTGSSGNSNTSSSGSGSSSGSDSISGPPVISVNGNNPATVAVGAAYSDLGATITGPQGDLNLGITASVDGATSTPIADITIDTSVAGTHAIVYSATDQNGLTGTATRTVTVVAPESTNIQATSTDSTDTSDGSATTSPDTSSDNATSTSP